MNELRKWERTLTPWHRDLLNKKTNPYSEDHSYSQEHELQAEEISLEAIEDPHHKEEQSEAAKLYAEDKDESSGSWEDYLKYKGL